LSEANIWHPFSISLITYPFLPESSLRAATPFLPCLGKASLFRHPFLAEGSHFIVLAERLPKHFPQLCWREREKKKEEEKRQLGFSLPG
jgi:hypothetical protein